MSKVIPGSSSLQYRLTDSQRAFVLGTTSLSKPCRDTDRSLADMNSIRAWIRMVATQLPTPHIRECPISRRAIVASSQVRMFQRESTPPGKHPIREVYLYLDISRRELRHLMRLTKKQANSLQRRERAGEVGTRKRARR